MPSNQLNPTKQVKPGETSPETKFSKTVITTQYEYQAACPKASELSLPLCLSVCLSLSLSLSSREMENLYRSRRLFVSIGEINMLLLLLTETYQFVRRELISTKIVITATSLWTSTFELIKERSIV